MNHGSIAGKLANLERVLLELRSLGTINESLLHGNWITLRAVERDLQVAVEILIDVCHRVVALSGGAPSASGREAVGRCQVLGALADGGRILSMWGCWST